MYFKKYLNSLSECISEVWICGPSGVSLEGLRQAIYLNALQTKNNFLYLFYAFWVVSDTQCGYLSMPAELGVCC